MAEENEVPQVVVKTFDGLMAVHRPLVLANIRRIRRRHPNATPEQLIRVLERDYLNAVTAGGAAVGASAAVPGVGTGASLVLSGAETAAFLEASALFAQSVAEIHGIAVVEPERSRALVMALMLGASGKDLVRQFAGQVGRGGQPLNAYWGELITNSLPKAVVGQLTDRIKKSFMKRFVVRQGGSVLGRLVPFGIGAVVGGTGNRLLGRKVVQSAREAFPPPPLVLRAELEPQDRGPTGEAPKRFPGLVGMARRRKEARQTPALPAADGTDEAASATPSSTGS
ncbi:hypothetical protein [Naasia sp. SYSU D00948]|uniref:hypothetical protein n=1 Tax=Naasia sp. SYSU D00948 TaxID=2817379 RepID=UPI001B30C159|nr:hypothetical protein [Naasia sp. SYSU D00948]